MARKADFEVAAIGAAQYGLVTPDQASAAGMSRRTITRRVATGEWERCSTRVIGLPFGEPCLERLLMAAQLHQPVAVASRRAAARLHGFTLLIDVVPEVTVDYRSSNRNPFARVHRSADLFAEDIVAIGPLQVTSVARTAADLFTCYHRGRGERIVDDLLLSGRMAIDELAAAHDRYAGCGRPTTVIMREVIADRSKRADIKRSKLETAFLGLVESTELDDPDEQVPLPGWVEEPGHADFAYSWARVIVEVDGRRWHGHREQFDRDRRRDNAAQIAGWIVLRFTWEQVVHRPEYVLETIRAAVRQAA